MAAAMDAFGYLLRSDNRVAVLRTLATAPRTRRELADATGATRVTLSRILSEMEERRWVERDGDEFRVTPLGATLAEEVARLERTAETVERLQDVVQWLPLDALDVDVRDFADARVTLADESDPTSPGRRYASVLGDADRIQVLSSAAKPDAIRVHRKAVERTDQSFEIIHTTRAVDAIAADPEMRSWVRAIMDSGQGTYYHTEGPVPCNLLVADGTAVFSLVDDRGTRPGIVESDADPVVAAARSTFDDVREAATELDDEAFESWTD
jgi:predicted transcriptional regulator